MKKYAKILTLIFIVAVAVTVIISTAVTTNAAEVYYELYESESSQEPFYSSTKSDLVIVNGGKTAGYVKVYKDITQSEMIDIKKDLIIDLNGNSFIHSNINDSKKQRIRFAAGNVTITIKNGTFDSEYMMSFDLGGNARLIFEDALIKYNFTHPDNPNVGSLIYGGSGGAKARSLTLINSTMLLGTNSKVINYGGSNPAGYIDEEGFQVNLINSFILDNSEEGTTKGSIQLNESGTPAQGVDRIHVNLMAGSGINVPLHPNTINANLSTKDRVLRIEKGSYVDFDSVPVGLDYKIEFYQKLVYDESAGIYLPGEIFEQPKFALSGREDLPYAVCEKYCSVTWVYLEGNQYTETRIDNVADFIIPTFTLPEVDIYLGNDGIYYYSDFIGWTTDELSNEPEDIALTEENNIFYAIYIDKPVSFVIYDDDGEMVNTYVENKLTAEILGALPESYVVYAQRDIEYAGINNMSGLESITIKLNGNSLNLIYSDGASSGIAIPQGSKTLTIEDGIVYSEGGPAIVGGGSGSLILDNVTVKSVGSYAIGLDDGSVVLTGGAVKSYFADYAIAVGSNASSNGTISFDGTEIFADNGKATAVAFLVNGMSSNSFNHTVTLEGVTVNGAALLKSEGVANANSSLTLNVFDSELNISDNVFSVSKNAGFKLTVNYKNSVSDSDPRVGIGSGSFNLAEGMTLVEYMDKFIAVEADTTLDVNMTLTDSFAINFYLPLDTDVELLTVDGRVIFDMNSPGEPKQVSVNGQNVDRYVATYEGVRPNNAAKSLSLSMRITSGQERYYYETSYSVVDYVESVITSTGTPEAEREFGRAILAYIKAAYEYFSETSRASEDELARLNTLANKYAPTEREVPTVAVADKTAAKAYVSSVQYRLRESVSFVINLTEAGQNAQVSVKIDGREVLTLAENHGKAVAEIKISAVDLSRTVSVTVGTASFDYTLSEYVKSVENTENAALSKMLRALYVYSVAVLK
jgi:hypothetical protein